VMTSDKVRPGPCLDMGWELGGDFGGGKGFCYCRIWDFWRGQLWSRTVSCHIIMSHSFTERHKFHENSDYLFSQGQSVATSCAEDPSIIILVKS
jgi:hypothetical protein